MNNPDAGIILTILSYMATLFIFMIGLVVIALIILYIFDVSQTRHAIRRNYPVIGHLRYVFERLGEFFRQYFFAMDREDKALRVKNYVNNMVREVGVIAHSCGVKEPRELRVFHARIVTEGGRSVPLDEYYPGLHG